MSLCKKLYQTALFCYGNKKRRLRVFTTGSLPN